MSEKDDESDRCESIDSEVYMDERSKQIVSLEEIISNKKFFEKISLIETMNR